MVFKKIIFQNRYVALETPSMENTILNFHFDYPHPSLSRFPFLFHLLSCSGWCTIFVLRRQILASLEEEICGVSPLSSSPCPSSFSGSTTTRSSLNTSWSISPIIITESSGGSDGVFSRSNLLQWIEGPSSPSRSFDQWQYFMVGCETKLLYVPLCTEVTRFSGFISDFRGNFCHLLSEYPWHLEERWFWKC